MNFDAKMTALANEIRALLDQTETLSVDEMTLNIEAANASRVNIIAALREMGVTVADDASISELANLITTIDVGIDTSDATATSADLFTVSISSFT